MYGSSVVSGPIERESVDVIIVDEEGDQVPDATSEVTQEEEKKPEAQNE